MYRQLSYDFTAEERKYIKEEVAKIPKSANDFSNFTFERTYLRNILDHKGNPIRKETKEDNFERVVRGTFSLLEDHLRHRRTYQRYADEIRQYAVDMMLEIYKRHITPPGRGLWAMGTQLVNGDYMGMPLVNCTFITSKNIDVVKWEFFRYVFDTLMVGVGVGFDTEGTGKVRFQQPVRGNYLRYDNYYKLIDQLNGFSSNKFCNSEGKSYVLCEVDYINNLQISHEHGYRVHIIQDSREGWTDALCELLKSYMLPGSYFVVFDYSQIRPEGTILKKFGGRSSGPKPLAELLCAIRYIIETNYIDRDIDARFIIDVCNMIARTVVAGNVRRSSEICISDDINVLDFKQYSKEENRYRSIWGWASNNSYTVKGELLPEILNEIMKRITVNGEPGIFFLGNARKYGRIIDGVCDNDMSLDGTNPCGEISLEGTDTRIANHIPYSAGGETCNLGESMPSNYGFDFLNSDIDWDLLYRNLHNDPSITQAERILIDDNKSLLRELIGDYLYGLFLIHLYCKIVTLVPVHWKSTQAIQDRNRRIGISITGISVLLSQMGLNDDEFASEIPDTPLKEQSMTFKRFAVFLDYCARVVDDNDVKISEMLGIPKSIKKRTVKPSGTVSICNDVPAGMHFPYSDYYIRRVRINNGETELIKRYTDAGYGCEVVPDNPNTVAISFPVKTSTELIPRDKVDVNLQFKILLYLQKYWADNQVSCTITFKKEEEARLQELIWANRDILKGLSCYPYFDEDKYIEGLIKQKAKGGVDEESAKLEVYKCLPNERITREKYYELMANIKPVANVVAATEEIEYDTHCDGDRCIRIPVYKK